MSAAFLMDTNVVSELRKGDRADPGVVAWFEATPGDALFLSVLVLGELRRGIESVRPRDPRAADALERWLGALIAGHAGRILPVDETVADRWGRASAPDPVPAVDGLLAATALVRGMTLVTRNVHHVRRTGVPCLDPFSRRP